MSLFVVSGVRWLSLDRGDTRFSDSIPQIRFACTPLVDLAGLVALVIKPQTRLLRQGSTLCEVGARNIFGCAVSGDLQIDRSSGRTSVAVECKRHRACR